MSSPGSYSTQSSHSHELPPRQQLGIRNDEVAASACLAVAALNPMKIELSPTSLCKEGLQLS